MHSTRVLQSEDFEIMLRGSKCSLEQIFPEFDEQDRLGLVVRHAFGSAGASALLMAAITKFYDFHRPSLGNEPDQLRIYPEFFIFHVGEQHMDHYWMDIWTPNKEVIVEDDPEQILEAINDRGITRLLVEDIPPSRAIFLPETVNSAKMRIKSALAYSPTGRVDKATISIASCPAAEQYVFSTFKRTRARLKLTITDDQVMQHRTKLTEKNRVVESYRQVSVTDALSMLTLSTSPCPTTSDYLSMA